MAKSAGSDTVLLSRAFDDGTTLLVRGAPGADGVAEGLAISEAYCARAECTCHTVSVRGRRLQSSDSGVSVIEDRKVDTKIDLDTREISLDPAVPPDAQDVELLELMRGLFDSALPDVLRGRWQRALL